LVAPSPSSVSPLPTPATPMPPGSFKSRSRPQSENTTPTPARRTALPPMSLDTSITSAILETPQRHTLTAMRTPVVDRTGHSWVEIDITPVPPSSAEHSGKAWTAVCRMRVPWPSVSAGGSQRCDFGYLRPDGFESGSASPQTEVLDASIDGRKAEIQIFPSPSAGRYDSHFGTPPRSGVVGPEDGTGSFRDWTSYVRVIDPEARYGGTLEVLYRIYGFESRGKILDVLLPTFTVLVSRLDVKVNEIPGTRFL
jgi:hypothetical protein